MMGSGNRPVGVGLPQGQRQPDTQAPARRILNIAESREFAIEFSDDDGQVHKEIMHRIGGVWHRAPNGENYAASLRRINPTSWLVKQLEERIADHDAGAASIPKEDAVDVTGDGEAAPAASAGG